MHTWTPEGFAAAQGPRDHIKVYRSLSVAFLWVDVFRILVSADKVTDEVCSDWIGRNTKWDLTGTNPTACLFCLMGCTCLSLQPRVICPASPITLCISVRQFIQGYSSQLKLSRGRFPLARKQVFTPEFAGVSRHSILEEWICFIDRDMLLQSRIFSC